MYCCMEYAGNAMTHISLTMVGSRRICNNMLSARERFDFMFEILKTIYDNPNGLNTRALSILTHKDYDTTREMLNFLQRNGMINELFNDEVSQDIEWFITDHGEFEFLRLVGIKYR